jgi:glucokinase
LARGGQPVTETTVGVDLGGTKILGLLADSAGKVLATRETRTGASDGPEAVVGRLGDLIADLLRDHDRPPAGAIGLSSPGPLDHRTGLVYSPPNLPGWDGVPLRSLVEERFGLPTVLENDANSAGFAEALVGAGRGHGDLLYVNVGTGVGGAVVIGGRIHHGAGFAGELGHIVIAPDGPPCPCGGRGCVELFASGTGIARQAARARESGDLGPPGSPLDGRESVSAIDVARAAEAGDEAAQRIIRQAGHDLGVGLASAINLLSPEVVVLGGGVIAIGERYLSPAREAARFYSYVQRLRPAGIVVAALPGEAAARGAALLARTRIDSGAQAGLD